MSLRVFLVITALLAMLLASDRTHANPPEGLTSPVIGLIAIPPNTILSDGRGPIDRAAQLGVDVLAPAGLLVSAPMVLAGARTLQAQDASELVDWIKAKGRAVRLVHAGAWSASLECALQLEDVLETKVTLVAAADVADALGKLKAGAVDLLCEAAPAVMTSIRAGEVVAHMLASDERLPALWDVATADQAGLPLFSATVWLGLYAAAADQEAAASALQSAPSEQAVQTLADLGWTLFAASHRTREQHTLQLSADAERRRARLDPSGHPIGR